MARISLQVRAAYSNHILDDPKLSYSLTGAIGSFLSPLHYAIGSLCNILQQILGKKINLLLLYNMR